MAPKRLKKSCTIEDNGKKYENLSISDALCPICRSIIIEPVTLPCTHSFCLACFNGTVENTTLTCPLCRTRIGSWLRSARKEKRIVNTLFWTSVQIKFPNEIRKRLDGDDVILDDDAEVNIKLADPGEIRREYEIQLERERSVIQKERDTEEKASEIVIKKILEEEKEAARLENEKLRFDEEIAKRLAAENVPVVQKVAHNKSASKTNTKKSSIDKYLIALSKKKQHVTENNTSSSCSSTNNIKDLKNEASCSLKLDTSPGKKSVKSYTSTIMCQSRPNQNQKCKKPLQHLLLAKTLQCERANSNDSDSGDSIKQEMRYFKPIRIAPSVDKYQDGQVVHIPLLKLPTVHAKSNSTAVIRSPQINRTTLITTHPKSAFVSMSTNMQVQMQMQVQPSIINESGKIIKQYYNRKKNSHFAAKQQHQQQQQQQQPCTITSSSESPLLGFEVQNNKTNHINIINDFIKTLSQNVNGVGVGVGVGIGIGSVVLPHNTNINIKKLIKVNETSVHKNAECFNGFKPINKCELNIQEQLDLEFAKRLHEELNNPRQTRASHTNTNTNTNVNMNMNKKTPSKTRSSPRKRQVTLEELITPKKFKI